MSKSTFVDIFAGCGGLSLGLMQAGWQGVFAVEHDKNAFKTLQHNLIDATDQEKKFAWPSWLEKTPHDATTFVETHRKELMSLAGSIDMIVGGPPCQGFSTAGRRDPNDPRNKLVSSTHQLI